MSEPLLIKTTSDTAYPYTLFSSSDCDGSNHAGCDNYYDGTCDEALFGKAAALIVCDEWHPFEGLDAENRESCVTRVASEGDEGL